VRIRGYRTRSRHYNLASGPYNNDVKARYLVIGDYYAGVAEAELVADRLERKKQLEEMRRDREAVAARCRKPNRHRTMNATIQASLYPGTGIAACSTWCSVTRAKLWR
jgi:hypothetical protein